MPKSKNRSKKGAKPAACSEPNLSTVRQKHQLKPFQGLSKGARGKPPRFPGRAGGR